jgi:hypothetical protein
MNHSLESEVNLASTNDLGDITRVIGFKQSNLDSLFLEISFGLGQVKRGMVRRSVPDSR